MEKLISEKKPLSEEGVKAAKEFLGLPVDKDFYVAPEAYEYFDSKKDEIIANDKWIHQDKAVEKFIEDNISLVDNDLPIFLKRAEHEFKNNHLLLA